MQRRDGTVTEQTRLWADISKALFEDLRAMLRVLRSMVKDLNLTPALKADIEFFENELRNVLKKQPRGGNPKTGGRKPASGEKSDGTRGKAESERPGGTPVDGGPESAPGDGAGSSLVVGARVEFNGPGGAIQGTIGNLAAPGKDPVTSIVGGDGIARARVKFDGVSKEVPVSDLRFLDAPSSASPAAESTAGAKPQKSPESNVTPAAKPEAAESAAETIEFEVQPLTPGAPRETIKLPASRAKEKPEAGLDKPIKFQGKTIPRREAIEKAVASGFVVRQEGSGRILTKPDNTGDFFNESSLTKAGMDYAESLIAKNAGESVVGDALSEADRALIEAMRGLKAAPLPDEPSAFAREKADILKAAPRGNDGHPLAPNGQRSNLTEDQWAAVRTGRFKKWFGDWLEAAKAEVLRGPVVARVRMGVIEAAAGERASDAAYRWLRENPQSDIHRLGLGNVVFDEKSISDSLGHGFSGPKLNALTAVRDVVEKGSELDRSMDFEGKPLRNWVIAAPVELDGKRHTMFVRIRKDVAEPGSKHRFYVHEILLEDHVGNEETSPFKTGSDPEKFRGKKSGGTGFYLSLARRALAVNPESVSKVIDANGEPLVLFHGTDAEFDVFDEEFAGSATAGIGTDKAWFLTDDYELAEERSRGGKVLEVFVKADDVSERRDENDGGASLDEAVNEAFAEDRDAVWIRDARDSSDMDRGSDLLALLFKDGETVSNKIKSATDNSGEFSRESESVLRAAPLSEIFTKPIPPERIAAFIDVARKYLAEGVSTPEALAGRLATLADGKFRAFSQSIWGAFIMVNPAVDAAPDWAGVYAGLGRDASKTAKSEHVSDDVSQKPGGIQVIRGLAGDVRDLLLADEAITIERVRGLRPEYSTLSRKEMDEAVEAGITLAARRVAEGRNEERAFWRLLNEIYANQPSLNAKTSTSKINQAFSTPAPLAYVASRLADVAGGKIIYEPSAGHGMLLLESKSDQTVQANEIDPARRDRMEHVIDAGFIITGEDGTTHVPSQSPDRVIANPPFGSVMLGDGTNVRYQTAAGETTAIDHAIMLQSLESMTPEGRAAFIIGGPPKTVKSDQARRDFYGKGKSAAFFKHLHDNFGVVDHFTVAGELYEKQGAGWPVDVIVIQGRQPSRTALPSAKAPRMLSTWGEIFQTTQLTDEQRIHLNRITEGEMREAVRGMADRLAGIERMGGTQAAGTGTESDRGKAGTGGTGNLSVSAKPAEANAVSDPGGGRVDGSRDEGAQRDAGLERGAKPAGESAGPRESSERRGDSAGSRVPVKESGRFQAEYTPFSGEKGLDTLLPKNMVGPVATAFARIKADIGPDFTGFVREKLGYPEGTDITRYLAGEQIDAVTAAIWNFERGGALIVGDQTGIGKGRIAAALMKYAVTQGFTPVFMTQKPTLHDTMIVDDLADIAATEIVPAVMDTSLKFDSGKKRKLDFGEKYFDEAAKTGKLPGKSNAVFVTYDQITADDAKGLSKKDRASARNAGEPPADKWRMRALRAIAPNAVFILDESHLASGQSTRGWRVADVIGRSKRVYYSSATSVKRPENMGIYFKTNVGTLTGGNMQDLTELMNRGGVPAMQVVSAMLAQDGQYLRRERGFEGVKFTTHIAEESADRDRGLADGLTSSLRQIVTVQDAMRGAAESINAVIAAAGKRMQVPAANRAKLETVNFSSKLHNIVGQYLLAIKTASAAETAIREIRSGKKVVVAVQSTMESAIDGIEHGGFEMSYKGLVLKYLDQMRFLKSGNKRFGKGEVEEFEIKSDPPEEFRSTQSRELEMMIVQRGTDPKTGDSVITINEKAAGELMRRAMWSVFERARDAIESADLGDLPVSPIDAMRQAVESAGIRTGEITGRSRGIDENGEIYTRPASETGQQAQVNVKTGFNDGDLDFLVINQSGSTGISLHASEKVKNQSPRVMIVAQPNLDINEFMQTLGRIHRSGQLVKPEFILLQTALPAEKRPAAILGRKMAMLNANTTSNAKTDVSEGNTAIDVFNQYGDEVVYKVLERDADLQNQLRPLGSSLTKFFNKETGTLLSYQDARNGLDDKPDGYIARTITGYLAILPVEEQDIFWEKTIADYQAYISYLDQIGQNALEAKALDLQAKTLSREVFTEKAEGDSAFAAPSYIDTVETKVGKTPLSGEEAVALSQKAKSGARETLQSYLAAADASANEIADTKARRAVKAWDDAKRSEFLASQKITRDTNNQKSAHILRSK